MPLCHAFQRHFNKVHTRNCSLYKKAKMKGGLSWMTKNKGNELARFLMGTIFLVIIISSMNKSQELTVFHGCQKLTSAMK